MEKLSYNRSKRRFYITVSGILNKNSLKYLMFLWTLEFSYSFLSRFFQFAPQIQIKKKTMQSHERKYFCVYVLPLQRALSVSPHLFHGYTWGYRVTMFRCDSFTNFPHLLFWIYLSLFQIQRQIQDSQQTENRIKSVKYNTWQWQMKGYIYSIVDISRRNSEPASNEKIPKR